MYFVLPLTQYQVELVLFVNAADLYHASLGIKEREMNNLVNYMTALGTQAALVHHHDPCLCVCNSPAYSCSRLRVLRWECLQICRRYRLRMLPVRVVKENRMHISSILRCIFPGNKPRAGVDLFPLRFDVYGCTAVLCLQFYTNDGACSYHGVDRSKVITLKHIAYHSVGVFGANASSKHTICYIITTEGPCTLR